MDGELRTKAEATLKELRENGTNLTRYAFMNKKGKITKQDFGTICTGPMRGLRNWGEDEALLYCFNGESHPNSSSPDGHLEGGALSLKWLKFITSELSPYREIAKACTNLDDLEKINAEGGFIIENYGELGGGAMLGFLIQTRFAQEQNQCAKQWSDLCDLGIDPRVAYFMAAAFVFDRKYEKVTMIDSMPNHGGITCEPVYVARNWYHGYFPYDSKLGEKGDKDFYNPPWKRNSTYGDRYHRKGLGGLENALGKSAHKLYNKGGGNVEWGVPSYSSEDYRGWFGAKEGTSRDELVSLIMAEVDREADPIMESKEVKNAA